MDVAPLLHGLNPAQHEAVTTDAHPLCIVAGAGSGKTRVLTRRIAHRVATGQAEAPHVLALTFSRKAAGELRSRLGRLGLPERITAGTFHSVAYAQLRRRWADRGEAAPALVQSKLRLLVPLLGRHGSGAAVQPADVAAEIEWAKARLVPASQYEVEAARAGRQPPIPAAQLALVYERYELEKRRRGVLDFDDLLVRCAAAFDHDPDFAAGQRWRFRHLFVDEFQDVNPAQFRLLRAWLGEGTDLCVVGDPNQAIYSWNGADPRLLGSFERLFPGATTIRLDHNYRSSPQILAVAGAILADGASPGEPAASATALVAHQPDGPTPEVTAYPDERAEARGVAARLRRAHRPGTAWSQLAVLARTNAQLTVFEEAFQQAGIPYRLRGEGAFLQRPEVRDALRLLRQPPAVPFRSRLVDLEELAGADGSPDRQAHLEQLVRLAREHLELDPGATVEGFSTWLAATLRSEDPGDDAGGDAVDLVTFHRAKGLEWREVFVAGLERGLVPIGHADGPEATAEERRLLYVALTRAEAAVHCSWSERRTFGSATVPRQPSPWLTVIDAVRRALLAGPEAGDAGDWRAVLAAEQARLRSLTGGRRGSVRTGLGAHADPELFDALKRWRAEMARTSGVPAYVIFHDTTLAAVAEAQPVDLEDLLRVPGLGPVKADRYGPDLLALVASHRRSA